MRLFFKAFHAVLDCLFPAEDDAARRRARDEV
jgi:hypothetical protein